MASEQAPKRIGELLMERRLITQEQLDEALSQQRVSKEFIGEILIRLGFVTPEALLAVLSARYHIPHESLRVEQIDWSVVKQFSFSRLSQGKCFPIRADAESVTMAIANPLDAWALSSIERMTGMRRVNVVLVLEQELQRALRAYQQQSLRVLQSNLDDHGDHADRKSQ